MRLADERMKMRTRRRGATLLSALAGLLAITYLGADPAYASGGETSHGEAAGANGEPVGPPVFPLPPIVVNVHQTGAPSAKTFVFKADLVFDEVDKARIDDTMSVTKSLLPRIMDSVITGIQGRSFPDLNDIGFLNDVVLERSNEVLKPFGVVVASLRLTELGRR